jgi:hypothetical protein
LEREKDYPGVKPGQLPRRGPVDSSSAKSMPDRVQQILYSNSIFKNLIRYPTLRSPKDRTQVRVASDFLDRISGAGIFSQPPQGSYGESPATRWGSREIADPLGNCARLLGISERQSDAFRASPIADPAHTKARAGQHRSVPPAPHHGPPTVRQPRLVGGGVMVPEIWFV